VNTLNKQLGTPDNQDKTSEALRTVRYPGFFAGLGQSPAAIATVMAGLLVWLWPIGVGGKMPVGGDVTQFFLGLMGILARSLRGWRLPIWNDLWGYGFPGIGESQMGVYYPPHLVMYGTLPTEWAYASSLVLHTLWGGLGTWWAARKFGVSPMGSGLAAFVFSASGFFVIHMPHPWGYTTGCWMPWAWGMAWSILCSARLRLALRLFVLSLILVLQLLPGHFQLAFLTQVGIVLMLAWFLLDPMTGADGTGEWATTPKLIGKLRVVFALGACLVTVFPLAALQLWPTARLARLAAERDYEYLSGFAATPLHLVSYVAPGLFHGSTLWRPLVWTPFHTSPEEHLAYVGLVPLFLAAMAVGRLLRGDPAVRMLSLIGAVTLYLSLGPYLPGFRLLINLPGFSYFRAPARWALATALVLAILAGKGIDLCGQRKGIARWLAGLSALAVAWILIVLGLVELALESRTAGATPWAAGLFQKAFEARPWTGDSDFNSVLSQARNPAADSRIPAILAHAGVASRPVDSRSFAERRYGTYARELGPTTGVLAAMVAVAWLLTFRAPSRFLPASLIVITVVDLVMLGQTRLIAAGPLRPLIEQSPVLARLAQQPRGTRIVDGSRNLPMVVGLAPISAYRTLDLPALEPLTALARGPLGNRRLDAPVRNAMRACGVGVRVLDPVETALARLQAPVAGNEEEEETLEDPALAGWVFGPSWRSEQGAWSARFRIIHAQTEPARAWFLPLTAVPVPAMLDSWSGELEPLLDLFDRARPLPAESLSSQRVDVGVKCAEPGWVIVSQMADPQWQAGWTSESGYDRAPAILPTFRRKESDGGWQRVRVPGPGRWTLHLEYVARDVQQGLAISAAAWLAWGLLLVGSAIRNNRGKAA
jgi:hypothetical protein